MPRPLRESRVHGCLWSPHEKERFFGALARRTSWDDEGIAEDVKSKTPEQVRAYLDLLENARQELDEIAPLNIAHFPTAKEVPESVVEWEESKAVDALEDENERVRRVALHSRCVFQSNLSDRHGVRPGSLLPATRANSRRARCREAFYDQRALEVMKYVYKQVPTPGILVDAADRLVSSLLSWLTPVVRDIAMSTQERRTILKEDRSKAEVALADLEDVSCALDLQRMRDGLSEAALDRRRDLLGRARRAWAKGEPARKKPRVVEKDSDDVKSAAYVEDDADVQDVALVAGQDGSGGDSESDQERGLSDVSESRHASREDDTDLEEIAGRNVRKRLSTDDEEAHPESAKMARMDSDVDEPQRRVAGFPKEDSVQGRSLTSYASPSPVHSNGEACESEWSEDDAAYEKYRMELHEEYHLEQRELFADWRYLETVLPADAKEIFTKQNRGVQERAPLSAFCEGDTCKFKLPADENLFSDDEQESDWWAPLRKTGVWARDDVRWREKDQVSHENDAEAGAGEDPITRLGRRRSGKILSTDNKSDTHPGGREEEAHTDENPEDDGDRGLKLPTGDSTRAAEVTSEAESEYGSGKNARSNEDVSQGMLSDFSSAQRATSDSGDAVNLSDLRKLSELSTYPEALCASDSEGEGGGPLPSNWSSGSASSNSPRFTPTDMDLRWFNAPHAAYLPQIPQRLQTGEEEVSIYQLMVPATADFEASASDSGTCSSGDDEGPDSGSTGSEREDGAGYVSAEGASDDDDDDDDEADYAYASFGNAAEGGGGAEEW